MTSVQQYNSTVNIEQPIGWIIHLKLHYNVEGENDIFTLTIAAIIGFWGGRVKKLVYIIYVVRATGKEFFLFFFFFHLIRKKRQTTFSRAYTTCLCISFSSAALGEPYVLIFIFLFASPSGDMDIQFINVISRSRITITSRNGKH